MTKAMTMSLDSQDQDQDLTTLVYGVANRRIEDDWRTQREQLLRYDTRCYFNVRSKADMSRLNLPHGSDN